MMLSVYQQFCFNLDHHGGDANSGITHAFINMCEETGFEVLIKRTTLTFRRNGRTIVMNHWRENGGTVVGFRLRGDKQRIVTVRFADLHALARRGNRQQRLQALQAALFKIVKTLHLATDAVAA